MKFLKKVPNLKLDLEQSEQSLAINGRFAFKAMLILIVVLGLSALAVFFIAVKSPELVLVPDVVGKDLTEALQEMQIKELYPKIQLHYSNSADEKGLILEQTPSGGAIVKAGRRINLTVSQGVILDRVEDYVGMNVDALRTQLQTLFSASNTPMIRIPDTLSYMEDVSEAGTILGQNPPPNTSLSRPITLDLVVSSGPGNEEARIPNITGLSLNDTLLQLSRNKIIFNFTAQVPEEGQESGVVLSQIWPVGLEALPIYSRIEAVISIPIEPVDDLVYGLLTENLPQYPYALPVELIAEPVEGETYTVVSFNHNGGLLTIPYAVAQDTRLTLFALGNEVLSFIAQ